MYLFVPIRAFVFLNHRDTLKAEALSCFGLDCWGQVWPRCVQSHQWLKQQRHTVLISITVDTTNPESQNLRTSLLFFYIIRTTCKCEIRKKR